MTTAAELNELLRSVAPRTIAVLTRRFADFAACEDAVQEALLAASTQWPRDGVPANPQGWLITVALRRYIEKRRADAARRRREERLARERVTVDAPEEADDTLTLFFLCCHPTLTMASQVALTLRAVGGLTTAEIARAFLVPEPTIAQRISRAKQRIKAAGGRFELPPDAERTGRLDAVLRVLYLVFTEGHAASSGAAGVRPDLTTEAIRLMRQVHARLPNDGEVAGLLALMLLTDARRPARVRQDGSLVPLAEQDRRQWDWQAIAEGTALIERALTSAPIGPYQVQAAIAAVHAEAADAASTDWRQILGLYELLCRLSPGPMVSLNRVVAVAMVHGSRAALAELDVLARDPVLSCHHRLEAIRAHVLELAGDYEAARRAYREAARRTLSLPERRYLESQASRPHVM